jgi:hypothetical protein
MTEWVRDCVSQVELLVKVYTSYNIISLRLKIKFFFHFVQLFDFSLYFIYFILLIFILALFSCNVFYFIRLISIHHPSHFICYSSL